MQTEINKLKKDYKIEIEERKVQIFDDEPKTHYIINQLKDNEYIDLLIRESKDIKIIKEIFDNEVYFFKDFLAVKVEDKIQIILTALTFRHRDFRRFEREDSIEPIISAKLNFHKNELLVNYRFTDEGDPIVKYLKVVRGAWKYNRIHPLILEIQNYKKPTSDGTEADVRDIVNSVLFDVEYSYGAGFEMIATSTLGRRLFRKASRYEEIPSETINLILKKYIPELIEYFHIGEKVDYLPFKFLCYYHIIEYFLDKSAYKVASEYIKDLVLKPDFHIKSDFYIGQAVNFLKKENDKYTSDKIKIERVFRQFINKDELKSFVENTDYSQTFYDENNLQCSKILSLSKIDFDNDNNFYQTLTKRIYALRCSIVHSNPDFDDSKAIPFIASPKNMDALRIEIELLIEIARTIIIKSKQQY